MDSVVSRTGGTRSIRNAAALRPAPLVAPLAFGLLGALGLLAFYLGLITLAQGWGHAVQQLAEDRWFVGAIMAGFGTQIGLFAYLRGLHARAAAGGVAMSTGTSTTAMLACCAHHLVDVLPILGLSAAAIFLNAYKTPLLWLGIAMNLVGAAYLAMQVRKQRRLVRQAAGAVGGASAHAGRGPIVAFTGNPQPDLSQASGRAPMVGVKEGMERSRR
jgi:hypothetical protein